MGNQNSTYSVNTKEAKEVDKVLDSIFGSKEEVLLLIRNGKWEEAADYADHICVQATKANVDWIWKQAAEDFDMEKANSVFFGNVAFMICHAEKNNIRKEEASKLKERIINKINLI